MNEFIPAKKDGQKSSFSLYLKSKNINNTDECIIQEVNSRGDPVFEFTILPPFKTCGLETSYRTSTKTLIFDNALWWKISLPDLPFLEQTYKLFDLQCEFVIKDLAVASVDAILQQQTHTQTEQGQANMTMKYWMSPPNAKSQRQPLSSPLNYAIGEIIYISIEIGGRFADVANPIIFLNDCYLSSQLTANAHRIYIVRNGCPAKNLPLDHGTHENGRSNFVYFYFRMVQFRPLGSGFYVHCDVTICKSFCGQNCLSKRRRRLSEDADGSYTIVSDVIKTASLTNGPLSPMITKDENNVEPIKSSNETDEGRDNNRILKGIILPVLLISSNMGILSLVGLLSYLLAKSLMGRRWAAIEKRRRAALIEDTIGHVSFTPQVTLKPTQPDVEEKVDESRQVSGKSVEKETLHSLCDEKDCEFVKAMKGKHPGLFSKPNHKRQKGESLWTQPVFDSTAFTCPTPFNSPPPTPPIVMVSTGTSPIRELGNKDAPSQAVQSPSVSASVH